MKASTKLLLLLIVSHFLVGILSGSLGWLFQFLIVSVSGIIAAWVVYKFFKGDFKKLLIVILPFYLFYSGASIYLRSFETYPIWIWGTITCLVSFYTLCNLSASWKRIAIILFFPLAGYFIIMPNNFAYIFQKSDLDIFKIDHVNILDSSGGKVDINGLKGKVTLFDIWSTSCIPCIKKFPDLQKLRDKYAKDSSVNIIALNIPLARDTPINWDRFTKPYRFEKFRFASETEAKKLSIYEVPLVLIFDKDLNCRYAGDLNLGWNYFIGNAETIINRLKSE